MSLYHRKVPERETEQVICLKEDQRVIREELKKRGLIAFVANGSILPRQSGNSDLPMKDAVPFQSPKSMEITIQLRHRGSITGMGIRKGITLIAGGGYHGKSTLLEALEKGVYDHIAGDGREFVITDDTAWKLRAEDGRKIKDVDISLFINHLPNGRNTRRFSTLDASGSTSQAANIIEAIEAKSQVLLIDEDTSATNFMVRDELMQRVIQKDKEPITPFLERARDLYEKAGISTILVVGSCGSYFYIADQIIQMDNYCPVDITEKTRKLLKEYKKPDCEAEGFALPSEKKKYILWKLCGTKEKLPRNRYGRRTRKIKSDGKRKSDAWQRTAGSSLSGAACGPGTDPDTGVSSQICKRAVQRQNNRSYGTDGISDPETGKRRDRKCERAERDSGRDGNATKTGDLCVL